MEREIKTKSDQQSSRKRILGSTEPVNFDNSNSQPVWIKESIVKNKTSLSVHDDDDSVGTSGSGGRNFSSARTCADTNRNDRGDKAWGWLYGFAVIKKEIKIPPSPPIDICHDPRTGRSPYSNAGSSKSNSSSPFGQVKLRKTGASIHRHDSPSTQTPTQTHNSPREESNQPKAVLIKDHWNTKYNGITIDLTPKEAATCLLQANPCTESDAPPKNLIELTHLHEPALIHSLRQRYEQGNVYTFCGKILLALNPFQEIRGLYSDQTMKQYSTRDCENNDLELQPHAYAIAHEAFVSMRRAFDDVGVVPRLRRDGSNDNYSGIIVDQSILVSGESGAGKTVTTKIVMQYLAKLSEKAASASTLKEINGHSHNRHGGSIEQQVLQSNPVLESFGNARTVRNDNSSRFGKFIEIQFDTTGRLLGASVKTYLLEKIRLIRQAEGERNYHIFYELLNGMKPRDPERQELGLQGYGIHDFRITAASGTFDRRDGVKDSSTFSDLRRAMGTVGFTADERTGIFKVISSLLHLSNVDFLETKADTVILDESNRSLGLVLDIFGVDLQSITNALCTTTITVGVDVVKKNLTLGNVEKAVEALMKATYGALFEFIVRRVNSSITVGSNDRAGLSEGNSAFIKILDIFGFESFEINSFEQLCINYCNESLQQQFNKHVFKLEQQEYEREGIAWSFISFPDNQDVLDLIEKKHTGIFSILDEQCKLAKCTDQSFANVTYEKCGENPRFDANRTQKARGMFCINHYAGLVEYSAESFLDKNKDELPKEATDFLLSSSTSIFVELGKILSLKTHEVSKSSSSRNFQRSSNSLSRASVGSQFASQLRILRESVDRTSPHYIRCLKPNDNLVPDNFVPAIIADQLRCAGVLEAVRVSRIGYPQRYSKDLFVQRYWILGVDALKRAKRARMHDLCEVLVDCIVPQIWQRQNVKSGGENVLQHRATFDLVSVGLQLGKTKVFLRHQAFEALEYLRGRKLYGSATCLQAAFRMSLQRKKYDAIKSAILSIQCCIRRQQATSRLQFLRMHKSTIVIQTAWRGFTDYSNYAITLHLAIWCQRLYRGSTARQQFRKLLVNYKSSVIQSWWRMTKERNYFLVQQYLAFTLQQHFRMKQACRVLKRLRIEAKDLTNVAHERDKLRSKVEEMRQQLKEANRQAKQATSNIAGEGSYSGAKSEEKKESDGDISDVKSLRVMYAQKDHDCRAKDAKILRLENVIETMKTEMEEIRDSVGYCQPSLSFLSSRSVASESISSPQRVLNSSQQSWNWRNKGCTTENTELDDSMSEDMSTSFGAGYFDNPIHVAVRAADDDALSVAVTNCEDVASEVNRGGRDGKSPLHLAISSKNFASAEFLLQNDSVVTNYQDMDGNTPLHYAHDAAFVKLLLEVGGANPNIPNERGFCAIHIAVQRRCVEAVKSLISHSANLNAADDTKWLTPLHLVAQDNIHDINFRSKQSQNQIKKVSPVTEITRLLCAVLDPSPDMDYQDKDGNTPLHHASILQHCDAGEIILLFLKNNANPNITNKRGQTPMHLFLHNIPLRNFDFFPDIVQLMLYQGCDVNLQSQNGCAALHLAVYHHDFDSAIQLLERNAQLHLAWQKPSRWEKYWRDNGSSPEVLCLDMIENQEMMRQLFSSISCAQVPAPVRPNCMQCKRKIMGFGKKNCSHCGSTVCSRCSEHKLETAFFPPYCKAVIETSECARVCNICNDILIVRKQEKEEIMGRELYVHSRQEDVSMLDMESSFLDDKVEVGQSSGA